VNTDITVTNVMLCTLKIRY